MLKWLVLLIAFLPLGKTIVGWEDKPKLTLSAYALFEGKISDQHPAPDVLPYQLNTPLFSDYAEKLRFVRLPAGSTVNYQSDKVLDFPQGTILVKTFYFPLDARSIEKGRKLIETRLLIHEATGWKALTYVWDDEQTEAYLEVAGDTKNIDWVQKNGKKTTQEYLIPNQNQCKGCHSYDGQLRPIGPKVERLNGDIILAGKAINQLSLWSERGILTGLPTGEELPRVPVWDDPATGSLADRARAWLDINCAHCHNTYGPAATSGLLLDWAQKDLRSLGIMKTPVAAGRGSGGLQYDIVPGKPEQSILVYRMAATDPGIRMPETGRLLVHKEGLELVKEWIKQLPN